VALLLLPKVFGADVAGREEREERRIGRGGFDGGAPVGFFAFDDADNRGDNHVGVVAASIALMVEAPVVHTSSTITTRAPAREKPSMRRPVP